MLASVKMHLWVGTHAAMTRWSSHVWEMMEANIE